MRRGCWHRYPAARSRPVPGAAAACRRRGTRHLNAFLEAAGQTPDAILFNGGFFIPEILRERVADVVGRWYGKRPEILENSELDLAVARGAAYYSYVRSTGSGILVRGGLPRTYYIGLGDPRDGRLQAVCLVPRGAEEGAAIEVDNPALQLVANRPVSFRLYSSLTRTDDKLGEVLEFSAADPDLHMHAPLNAVIRFGKKAEERLIPVKLGARLTEIGTLETWCESKISDNRWRLQFELRKKAAERPAERKAAAVVSEQALAASVELVQAVFAPNAKSPIQPEELPAKLEQTMGLGRNSWPLSAIRQLADAFLSVSDGRKKAPAYEVRWLNLAGFCLRPGFGYPRRRFPHRAGPPDLRLRHHIRQPDAVRDRLVDLLGPRGGRPEPQSADRRLPAALGVPPAARQQEAAPDERRPLARDVAHRLQPGVAAHRNEDGLGRSADPARKGRRLQGKRALVHLPVGRPEAVLRAHQPGDSAGHGGALGGDAAEAS
jgi:hypothetical protein